MYLLIGFLIGGACGFAAASVVAARTNAATAEMLDRVCRDDAIRWTEEEIAGSAARAVERAAARTAEHQRRVAQYAGAVEPTPVHIDMDRIIQIESSGNPAAVSSAGCRGLCQIAEATWYECTRRMGVDWTWDGDAFQPGENRAVGAYYINKRIPEMLRHYGIDDTVATRIGAYNWGIGNLRRAWEQHGRQWLDHAPRETREYMQRYENAETR